MAKPLGNPRVVLTIDIRRDPSLHALMILAGRCQVLMNINLESGNKCRRPPLEQTDDLELQLMSLSILALRFGVLKVVNM